MNIALVGYGAMGRAVKEVIGDEVKYIIAPESPENRTSFEGIVEKIDCIIDFSSPCNLDMIYDYAKKNKVRTVIATTGYSKEQNEKVEELSKYTAVLKSANFSLGIAVLNKLVREITPMLKDDYDIEIIEAHHNKKVDAPSGTAKMLLASVNESKHGNAVYGREGFCKRQKDDVGVLAVRGGTIAGEHEVMYCGEDEVITLKHSAQSKRVFAKGAYVAAKFLQTKETGLYDMDDVLL